MLVLVTGGCGFIGSNFIRLVLSERPEWRVVNLDALTYAGNVANLRDLADHPRYAFVKGDITEEGRVEGVLAGLDAPADCIVNFAAESHVDRSILGPDAFVRTNVQGTLNLLEQVRQGRVARMIQISTDEVYGSLGETGRFTETTPLDPSSPYSASKASADLLVQAYFRTYDLDLVITRCSNNYGPYQFPEKLIPLMITNALQGKELPVYGEGRNVRDWVHVEDHCRGILAALDRGRKGQVYNFGGATEKRNIEIVETIANRIDHGSRLIRFVKDRPGHDWRYAMDISKVSRELGWTPATTFSEGLAATIDWYTRRKDWWEPILTGEYRHFYQKWYGER